MRVRDEEPISVVAAIVIVLLVLFVAAVIWIRPAAGVMK